MKKSCIFGAVGCLVILLVLGGIGFHFASLLLGYRDPTPDNPTGLKTLRSYASSMNPTIKALAEYHHDTGHFPENLSDLSPKYLATPNTGFWFYSPIGDESYEIVRKTGDNQHLYYNFPPETPGGWWFDGYDSIQEINITSASPATCSPQLLQHLREMRVLASSMRPAIESINKYHRIHGGFPPEKGPLYSVARLLPKNWTYSREDDSYELSYTDDWDNELDYDYPTKTPGGWTYSEDPGPNPPLNITTGQPAN